MLINVLYMTALGVGPICEMSRLIILANSFSSDSFRRTCPANLICIVMTVRNSASILCLHQLGVTLLYSRSSESIVFFAFPHFRSLQVWFGSISKMSFLSVQLSQEYRRGDQKVLQFDMTYRCHKETAGIKPFTGVRNVRVKETACKRPGLETAGNGNGV